MVINEKNETRNIEGYLPNFHKAQIEIVEAEGRYKVIAAGRRFGKGVLGIAAAFFQASRGFKCRWVAPSYASDSYQSGWRVAEDLARQIPGLRILLQKRMFD